MWSLWVEPLAAVNTHAEMNEVAFTKHLVMLSEFQADEA